VVAACSNAVAGVLLERGREGVHKLLPGLEKMSDVSSSSSSSPALEKMSSQAVFLLLVLGGFWRL
jgi:hypothetical protein